MGETVEVRDIMLHNPRCVQLNSPVSEISEIFLQGFCDEIAVVDQTNRLRGLISRQDFYKLMMEKMEDMPAFQNNQAADIMRKEVHGVPPNMRIKRAAQILLNEGYHAMPVLKDGHLIGSITQSELLNYTLRSQPSLEHVVVW